MVVRRVVAAGLVLVALVGAYRLTVPAGGTRAQLEFLRGELDAGSAERMQRLFPEGYFFSWALYGLTWTELGRHEPEHRDEALREGREALRRLDSAAGTAVFDERLRPRYGVFHAGWSNWLRGTLVALDPGDEELRREFGDRSAELAAAFDEAGTPFLAAYPGQAWPVDSVVAVASLRLHDHVLGPRFAVTAERWVAAARQRRDPATGLLGHRADPRTGAPVEGARGSSQSVVHRFLVEVDPAFAREQYERFRERFVVRPLGLAPAVREYPVGTEGAGDVDSGPLVLGASLSATVVTLGAARVQGDEPLATALARFAELTGLPLHTWSTKRYGLGILPVGDAFLAWSRTARPWVAEGVPAPAATVTPFWRVPLLAVLALLAALPWLPAVLRRSRRGG
ncbi:MAG TPA: hypothetical protein VGD67_06755, partial [Pseudonocardiaceae bacterium]